MAKRKYKTIIQKLEEVTQPWVARYIVWHFTDEDKRLPFNEFKKCDQNIKDEKMCEDWLTREDAQKAIQIYMKHMKTYNLMQVYYKMLEKSLQGDTQASKWIVDFSNSPFFDESEDEIDTFLSGINIPSLSKG